MKVCISVQVVAAAIAWPAAACLAERRVSKAVLSPRPLLPMFLFEQFCAAREHDAGKQARVLCFVLPDDRLRFVLFACVSPLRASARSRITGRCKDGDGEARQQF